MYSESNSIPNDLIEEKLIDECYPGGMNYDELKEIVSKYKDEGSMLLMDDMLSYFNESFARIFYELSHHQSCTTVLLTQQLFVQNKTYKTLALNMQALFLMRNPRDSSSIIHLSKQVSPYRPGWLAAAYLKATKTPYSYLFLSFHQKSNDITRVLTRILPNEPKPIIVFIPNDEIK